MVKYAKALTAVVCVIAALALSCPLCEAAPQHPAEGTYRRALELANNGGYTKSLPVFKQAAAKGHTAAMNMLGFMYERGLGAAKDIDEAKSWYTKSAALGDKRAVEALERINGTAPAPAAPVPITPAPVKPAVPVPVTPAPVTPAPVTLGASADELYKRGVVEYDAKNYGTAAEYLAQAARMGNGEAAYIRGFMSEGIDRDDKEAYKWYMIAAEHGSDRAMNNIGLMYMQGRGIERDYGKAFQWYTRAAQNGSVGAMNNIGLLYTNGSGVAKDYAKALEWYERAAQNGSADAMYNIGVMHYNGMGAEKDIKKAISWLEKAAQNGHAGAKDALAAIREYEFE